MSKIRILPEQLANQIAAGEVVERPASVVKELVENSLDAGATRIEIEIEGAGTRLIRIIDNGEGMEEDDLLMSLERHGTSKIKTDKDLCAIATLGFRGEAIPSIGSVSKLTLSSRVRDTELGTQVMLEYGKLIRVHEIGCSYGTTVEVRNLFGNTPARRKFLRTARTELGHIEEIVKNYALGCPDISFSLRVNGRNSLYLDKTIPLEQRLGIIMRYDGPFIPLSVEQIKPLKRSLTGFLLPPEEATTGPARLRVFVNGRAVRDRMIAHGVSEGLRGFLMKGKNPSGMIHLQLNPEEIDVNVHPAKHEIRFRNSRDVHTFLSEGVYQAMVTHQQALKSKIFTKDTQTEFSKIPLENFHFANNGDAGIPSDFSSIPGLRQRDLRISKNFPPENNIVTKAHDREEQHQQERSWQSAPPPMAPDISNKAHPSHNTARTSENESAEAGKKYVTGNDTQMSEATAEKHDLLVIGQFDNLYILCENNEGLLVIDQHAAHERLLYEKLRKQYLEKRIARQTLMFPETIELSLFQAQLIENNIEDLDRMGFSIRDFGGNTFVISAIPAIAGSINSRELLIDVLEYFGSESQSSDGGGILEDIISSMACKAAVKAGTNLSKPEIDKLLDDMIREDLFSHCPHGRPVVKQFSKEEVKKWFFRT